MIWNNVEETQEKEITQRELSIGVSQFSSRLGSDQMCFMLLLVAFHSKIKTFK